MVGSGVDRPLHAVSTQHLGLKLQWEGGTGTTWQEEGQLIHSLIHTLGYLQSARWV